MQSVTQEWKDIQSRPFTNEQLVEINIGITDPDAVGKMTITPTSYDTGLSYSNINQTKSSQDNNIPRYGTFETNHWILDGSVNYDSLADVGFVSNHIYDPIIDDFPGIEVKLNFSEIITSILPGIEILWDNSLYGEFATEFYVVARNGSNAVASWYQAEHINTTSTLPIADGGTTTIPLSSLSEAVANLYVGNRIYDTATPPTNGIIKSIDTSAGTCTVQTTYKTGTSTCEFEITGYNNISIILVKWCCVGSRARINSISLGLGHIYTNDDITESGISHKMIVDTYGEELPTNAISFSLNNTDGKIFNIMSQDGITKYLMDRQPISLRYGMRHDDNTIEWVSGGKYWLDNWSAPYGSYSATFNARDKLLFLNVPFNPDAPVGNMTLSNLLTQVFTAAGFTTPTDYSVTFPTIQVGTSTSINTGSITVGYLPKETSIADALKYIAQAACVSFWIDSNGKFCLKKIDTTSDSQNIDYFITPDIMYQYPTVERTATLKEIRIKQYTYSWVDDDNNPSTPNVLQSTSSDYSQTISGKNTDQLLQIDNPLVINSNHCIAIASYIMSNAIDSFKVSANHRHDVRLEAGDNVATVLNDEQSFDTIVRNIDATFAGGVWKATTNLGITKAVEFQMAQGIDFSASTTSLNLSAFTESNPTISFTVDAQPYYYNEYNQKKPINGGIITWDIITTKLANGGGTAKSDTITKTITAGGRSITVTITGNYNFKGGLNFIDAFVGTKNFYSYSTASLKLKATVTGGYSETQNIAITNNNTPTPAFNALSVSVPSTASATMPDMPFKIMNGEIKSTNNIPFKITGDYTKGYTEPNDGYILFYTGTRTAPSGSAWSKWGTFWIRGSKRYTCFVDARSESSNTNKVQINTEILLNNSNQWSGYTAYSALNVIIDCLCPKGKGTVRYPATVTYT